VHRCFRRTPSACLPRRLLSPKSPFTFDRALTPHACHGGTLQIIEVTTTCPGWPDVIADLAAKADAAGFDEGGLPKLLVGAGTIMTKEQAATAADRGAQFLVSPVLDEGVASFVTNELKRVYIPGCVTPSEMWKAHTLGCQMQKLFPSPGPSVGPAWIKSCGGALPMLSIMPTAGTTAANAAEYLTAGAACIGAGNSFLAPAEVRTSHSADCNARNV